MHEDITLRAPRGFRSFSDSTPHAVPGTGPVTLVRQDTPAYLIPVNTPLSAIAIRVKLHKEYTICNIYIDHEFPLTVNHMKNLVAQLPPIHITERFQQQKQGVGRYDRERKRKSFRTISNLK